MSSESRITWEAYNRLDKEISGLDEAMYDAAEAIARKRTGDAGVVTIEVCDVVEAFERLNAVMKNIAPPEPESDRYRGLYEKFRVERTDGGSAPGGKHENCRYFVLDTDHDPHAIPALEAYVVACAPTHPKLADDLRVMIATMRLNGIDERQPPPKPELRLPEGWRHESWDGVGPAEDTYVIRIFPPWSPHDAVICVKSRGDHGRSAIRAAQAAVDELEKT